jgi:hypothetical protein
VLSDLRLVNLVSAPDFGFGQPPDGKGILAGSVPTAALISDGVQLLGQQLLALGLATSQAVLPSHIGIYPPTDRMSCITYWWGYELVFPPPTMTYLSNVRSISNALLNFLTAFSVFNNGVREILPFIRYAAQFVEFEWNAIKSQDKGKGVVCAATWVMPAALVPRAWDFDDPPTDPSTSPSPSPSPSNTLEDDNEGPKSPPDQPQPHGDGSVAPPLLITTPTPVNQ